MHLLLLAVGCNPWDLPDDDSRYVNLPNWDSNVVSAADGVYVRLPAAGALARVKTDGTFDLVDLDGASPDRMVIAPDGETVLAFASWPVCDDLDADIELVSDCREEDLSYSSELDIIRDGKVVKAIAGVPPQYNAFAFSGSGGIGVSYLDFSQTEDIDVSGVLNLTEAVFIDISTGDSHAVPIGFAAEKVLFNEAGNKAVVLSRSQVAMVDLATWAVEVSFPLTLDPDQNVQPEDVVLATRIDESTGDVTDYALVSISGRSEVYVLDLTNESIDIVELDAAPSDLLVDGNRTLLVYAGRAVLDALDHDFFEIESFELDEPCNAMLGGNDLAVLYNTGGRYHDVYVFDSANDDVIEFRAENPVMGMQLTADGAYALATLNTESSSGSGVGGFYDQFYGLQIFDLVTKDDPVALALESYPVGVEIVEGTSGAHALVLLEGLDELLSIDLATAATGSVSLEEPPLGIDAMPDGTFVVTHPSPLGLISFVDPADSTHITTAAGFASSGLLSSPVLPRRNVEE